MSFHNGQHGECGEDGDERDQDATDADRAVPGASPAAFGFVGAAPGEDGLGEDVVEELIGGTSVVRGGRDWAKDATALGTGELIENGSDLGFRSLRPVGEVGSGVGDLRLAAAHEEAEAVGGGVVLRRGKPAERVQGVVLDDWEPPSASRRASVSVCAPSATVARQSRSSTSCRNGASTRSPGASASAAGAWPSAASARRPPAAASSTALVSAGSME